MKTPNRENEAARLFYLEGFSREEVAEEMGVGIETVKSHLRFFRLRHQLGSRRAALEFFRQGVSA